MLMVRRMYFRNRGSLIGKLFHKVGMNKRTNKWLKTADNNLLVYSMKCRWLDSIWKTSWRTVTAQAQFVATQATGNRRLAVGRPLHTVSRRAGMRPPWPVFGSSQLSRLSRTASWCRVWQSEGGLHELVTSSYKGKSFKQLRTHVLRNTTTFRDVTFVASNESNFTCMANALNAE